MGLYIIDVRHEKNAMQKYGKKSECKIESF